MKKLLITLLLAFFMLPSFAQVLAGTWEGKHYLSGLSGGTPIKIIFELNKDSTYNVYSHMRFRRLGGKDVVQICSVEYDLIGNNAIRLREEALLSPNDPNDTGKPCFQQMDLKFKKKKKILQLDGYWQSVDPSCFSRGTLVLTKKR